MARTPRIAFDSIFGMQEVKDKLLGPARDVVSGASPAGEAAANGILMHGKPGNGKTLFAEALAGELQVPIVSLTYADVASKWLGEVPRVLSNCFVHAKANAPCVLFVDEIDSFLRSREFASATSEDLKVANTLLTEIVSIRNHRVVLVGATNYLASLDVAAVREGRFDFKVEITPPDEAARVGILRVAANKYGTGLEFDDDALAYVARRWQGYSVSRITAVAKALPAYARSQGLRRIGSREWIASLREVQGRSDRLPAGTKRLGELVLDAGTAQALSSLARRLADSYRIESLGGTVPRGALLYGAAGTGKTTAARALALETGWAFIETTGAQLLADRGLLDRLYGDAAERRPAVLFIDDGDGLMGASEFAPASDLGGRMKALLDGSGEGGVSDVLVMTATTSIGIVDPALLQAGRLDEQIELTAPGRAGAARVLRNWLSGKRVRLQHGLDLRDLACSLENSTFADINCTLQRALNKAIDRTPRNGTIVLAREDFDRAAAPLPMRRGSPDSDWRREA